MNEVIVFLTSFDEGRGLGNGIGNEGCVGWRESKVFCCEGVDYGVDFYNCGVDTMGYKRCWCCTDSKTTSSSNVISISTTNSERRVHT